MGAGSAVGSNNNTAGSGTFTIQPSAGVEWVVHNFMWSGPCTITITDGSHPVVFYTATALGYLGNVQIHLTNTQYVVMTDTSGSTNAMAYNGIETV